MCRRDDGSVSEVTGRRSAELCDGLKRGIGGIAGMEVLLSVVGRAVITRELRVVLALDGFGELLEKLKEFGGRLIGEIDR